MTTFASILVDIEAAAGDHPGARDPVAGMDAVRRQPPQDADVTAVELVQGEPEDAIARFAESHDIDVVVMGTVARAGIAGLVMGDTAERVLQRLRSSVLAVKPPGFVSPVAEQNQN